MWENGGGIFRILKGSYNFLVYKIGGILEKDVVYLEERDEDYLFFMSLR